MHQGPFVSDSQCRMKEKRLEGCCSQREGWSGLPVWKGGMEGRGRGEVSEWHDWLDDRAAVEEGEMEMCEMRTSDKSVRPTLSLSLLGGDIYKIYQLWNQGLMQAGLREFPSVQIMCRM